MIGYVTLGTNDLPRAAAFYDALLAELGAKRLWNTPPRHRLGRVHDPTQPGRDDALRRPSRQRRQR